MNEAQITVVGWLAQDPYFTTTSNGHPYLALRVGCTPRRFDRQSGQFEDLPTMFLTVHCWRGLAENVNASAMHRGVPLVVTGGSAQFRPAPRGGPMTEEDRQDARDITDQWSLGGPATSPTQDPAPTTHEDETDPPFDLHTDAA